MNKGAKQAGNFNLFADLKRRGLVADATPGLEELLSGGSNSDDASSITLYLGIDPTSDSLHLGSLLGVIMLERFRLAGHRSIALVGGATGMIGDPSGRSKERNLLDKKTLEHNFKSIRAQIQHLTEIPKSDFLDNRQWTEKTSLLDFLRDVGKHATVNQMVAKESVKARMEGEDGISFTEFSYMLLQANDFYQLYEDEGCVLQVGGSDQWGNIVAGTDLIRRKSGGQAHALVWPLVERADGQKFGKTADGTVWLDAEKTTPFELYQYLFNLDDKAACQLLYWFTLVDCDELDDVVASHEKNPEARGVQKYLARWVTGAVHGEGVASEVEASSSLAFGSGVPTSDELDAMRGAVPETEISQADLEGDEALIEMLVATELCSSKSDARRQLEQGAISINGENTKVGDFSGANPIAGKDSVSYFLVGRGKKKRHLLVLG